MAKHDTLTRTTMFPRISKLIALDRELRGRLDLETDPLTKELLLDKIKQLSPQIIREKVKQSLAREAFSRSYADTHNVPIKSGLRNVTGHHKPEKTEHWFWKGESEQKARQLEKARGLLIELFDQEPERHLVQKFVILGGVKKGLKELNLHGLWEVPKESRKAHKEVLLKMIEQKLTPESQLKGLI